MLFRYASGRSGAFAEQFLDRFTGRFLQCDAYDGYDRLIEVARPQGPWTLVHCWSHLRRRFVKLARNSKSPIAEAAVRQIAQLYAIEAMVRGSSPDIRLAARKEHSLPLVQRRQPGRLHRRNAHGDHCRPSPKRNRRPHAVAIPQNVKPASIGSRLSAYECPNSRRAPRDRSEGFAPAASRDRRLRQIAGTGDRRFRAGGNHAAERPDQGTRIKADTALPGRFGMHRGRIRRAPSSRMGVRFGMPTWKTPALGRVKAEIFGDWP
ncbi:IS66 family transposase [Bradyrhizobium vignae]|uniref:IS66 family transposase n=1 Tax=Bradyrhizobium vignae TaxID=1549949 RepID=UPI004062E15F